MDGKINNNLASVIEGDVVTKDDENEKIYFRRLKIYHDRDRDESSRFYLKTVMQYLKKRNGFKWITKIGTNTIIYF